jgi:inner membrane transporter RhtA
MVVKSPATLGPLDRVPPLSFFAVSALFHYLGPAFAVLLFTRVGVLGVALLRIWSAALAFALWRRPWRSPAMRRGPHLADVVALGVVLATMNTVFYLAIARLPLATVGAIEFLGVIILAAWGTRTVRNAVALVLAIVGVVAITKVRFEGDPIGFVFAFGNCALFVIYIVIAHRIANRGHRIDDLAAAMGIAAVVITPFGFTDARGAFTQPTLLLAGVGVGLCSSFIPYITDQLAMARLPRASFALMLSSLPVIALLIGAIVLRQIPTIVDVLGIGLVVVAIAVHKPSEE